MSGVPYGSALGPISLKLFNDLFSFVYHISLYDFADNKTLPAVTKSILKLITPFFMSNQKFKQSPRKFLIC